MEEHDDAIPLVRHEGVLSLDDLKLRLRYVEETKGEMFEGVHYGKIPGTPKPSLWKPGAEMLFARFQLHPTYEVVVDDLPGDHIRVRSKCKLFHVVTGRQEGEAVAVCTTKEKKYRYTLAERTCPKCGLAAIIKGKEEYGGGFICFAKKGGCGAKFADADKSITDQKLGQVENPDLADKWNTITQMATKRSMVSACLVATAASEFFTQDDDSDQRPSEPAPEEEKGKRLKMEPMPEESQQQQSAAGTERLATRGQRDIVVMSMKRWKVSDGDFGRYLKETYQVDALEQLPQRHLTRVLEWLELRGTDHSNEGTIAPPPASQPPAAPVLREIAGTIASIAVGAKVTQLQVRQADRKEYALFFRDPPLGMPAQDVGRHWEHLISLPCTAKCEPVKNEQGTVMLMLREIKVDLPPPQSKESKQRTFKEMQAAHDKRGNGLLSEHQKEALLHEADLASLIPADFDAFLVENYHQHTLDTLPAREYGSVLEHLKSGFAGGWVLDNGPMAPPQQQPVA
jgi:hypothetical protein